MPEDRKSLLEQLFATQRGPLQAFFQRRTRQGAEAADLAQEVYLRMLRVKDLSAIRNLEAYLFSVAANLVRERAVATSRRGIELDIDELPTHETAAQVPAIDGAILSDQQIARLRVVVGTLPPLCRAVVVLQYVHGLTQQQVADHLNLTPRKVKQSVAQALALCRRRMARWG